MPHPAATYVTRLFGSMAQCDQQWANTVILRVIAAATVGGYVAGYILESFLITTYCVLAAAAFCLVVCGPNWRQRSDGDSDKWVPEEQAVAYMRRLNKAEVAHAKAQGRAKPLVHHH